MGLWQSEKIWVQFDRGKMNQLAAEIVQRIYACLMNGDPLKEALRPLAERHNEVIFAFRVQRQGGDGEQYPYVETLNADPSFLEDFNRVAHENPNNDVLLSAPVDRLMRLTSYKPFSSVENTAYNHEFLRNHNRIESSSCIILKREGKDTAQINASMPRGYGGSSLNSLEHTMEAILPFAQSAYELSLQQFRRRAQDALSHAEAFWLEQQPTPSIIVGRGGRVKVMNKRAVHYLKQSRQLVLSTANVLGAAQSSDQVALDGLIHQTLEKRLPAGPLILSNENGPGLIMSSLPLHSYYEAPDYHRFLMVEGELALISLFDPTDVPRANEDLVQQVLGVTAKQSALILGLANGDSLRDSARKLNISYNTARNHMQNAMGRIGAGSQTEIVRLASTIMANAARFDNRG